jgi:hypothetical protein
MDGNRAAHWREFYDRAIASEEQIHDQMVELSREMPEDQRRLVEEADIEPLSSWIEDFRRRRDVWKGKEATQLGRATSFLRQLTRRPYQ